MLTVHTRVPGAAKITAPITYEREGSDGKRFVAAPLSVTNIQHLLPDNTATKRGETEVKGDRRRILAEDAISTPLSFDSITGLPAGKHGIAKMHTVIEWPWTSPIRVGSGDDLEIHQCKLMDSLIRLHVANLLPRLKTATPDGDVVMTGFESGVAISDVEYVNSPIARASYGLTPFGDNQTLGTEDNTVE